MASLLWNISWISVFPTPNHPLNSLSNSHNLSLPTTISPSTPVIPSRSKARPWEHVWPPLMPICSWATLNRISLTPNSINPVFGLGLSMTYCYSGPTAWLPHCFPVTAQQLLSCPLHLEHFPPPMSYFWTSMSALTMGNSAPLSMLNPPTPNNISTITAATPHQPNAPSLTPSPLEGIASVTILMISTLTPPTSLSLHLLGLPSPSHPNTALLLFPSSQPSPCPPPSQDPHHLSLITTCYPGLHRLK